MNNHLKIITLCNKKINKGIGEKTQISNQKQLKRAKEVLLDTTFEDIKRKRSLNKFRKGIPRPNSRHG